MTTVIENYFLEHRDRIFFVKHNDWRDEAEYRWVYYEPATEQREPDSTFVEVKGKVAALVLGADYSDAHLPVAQSFASTVGLNGDVTRCVWDRLNYRLDVFAQRGGRWVPVPYTGTVALTVRISIR